LQERLQAARAGTPVYLVKHETGPGHRKRFMVEVRLKSQASVPSEPLARGLGSTKKVAEQDAARRALEHLNLSTDAELGETSATGSHGEEPDRVGKETAAQ
jgi:ribonuclease-3